MVFNLVLSTSMAAEFSIKLPMKEEESNDLRQCETDMNFVATAE